MKLYINDRLYVVIPHGSRHSGSPAIVYTYFGGHLACTVDSADILYLLFALHNVQYCTVQVVVTLLYVRFELR